MTSAVPAAKPPRLALTPVLLTGAAVSAIAAATAAQMAWHLPLDRRFSIVTLNVTYWALWTLLTPAVLSIGMRWPIAAGQRARALAIHVVAGIAVAVLHIVLVTIAAAAIAAVFTEATWQEEWAALPRPTRMHIEWEITIYWALIGLAHAIAYKRQADWRAITAAQLEAELARAQTRALQQQLQPHFLFNTLQTISALVRRDAPAAERVIERLGDLLRQTLRAGDRMEVPLSEELALTRAYADIAQANMGDRLRITFNVPDHLLSAAVPALLLQPLVENAVRHGLAPRARGGAIVIDGERTGDTLELRVVDDGIGFGLDSTGIGLHNTTQRLSKLYGHRHQFIMENRIDGGAKITIRLPYRTIPSYSPEGVPCPV